MPQGFNKILQNRHKQRGFRKQLTFFLYAVSPLFMLPLKVHKGKNEGNSSILTTYILNHTGCRKSVAGMAWFFYNNGRKGEVQ